MLLSLGRGEECLLVCDLYCALVAINMEAVGISASIVIAEIRNLPFVPLFRYHLICHGGSKQLIIGYMLSIEYHNYS